MDPKRTILLVEDNEDDIFFMGRAMKDAGILNPVQIIENGEEVVHYLSGEGKYADRQAYPLPSLILLDLKLPRRSGLEVLEWMDDRPELERIVVVVLTTSKENRDVEQAYLFGANSYLVKPPTAEKLLEIVKALKLYWLDLNEYPDGSSQGVQNPSGA